MKLRLFSLFLLAVISVQADRTIKQRFTTRRGVSSYETRVTEHTDLVTGPKDESIFDINQKILKNMDLMDGDIKRKSNSKSSITDETMYWPGTEVPVEYSRTLPLLARAGIDDARVEYEIRTCMSFIDRTNEANYLHFEPQSGCWSWSGMQGGQQTVSIGSGCEKRAKIQHEMMHALGVYHQQSRTDRDDYVQIVTENIDSGNLYNFDIYDYEMVDDRRVPYDYSSVMHYPETAFSINGGKTILTHDPTFQGVIGQRRTFSVGDADMINRMYKCGDPKRLSYSCGFETDNACGYVQESSKGITLTGINRQSTEQVSSSKDSAPATDATYGEKSRGHYMLFNATDVPADEVTVLRSMRLKTKVDTQCLEFSYYMALNTGSKAQVNVYLAQIDTVSGEVTSSKLLTQLSGDHGQYWNLERFTFQSQNSVYKLLFEVESGGFSDDVIALDDIQIQDKPCETTYFKVHDFNALLESTSVNEAVWGPTLYDDEGYAFRLFFYPHGYYYSGYLSVYFTLAAGPNDDSLSWPYYDRVIKLSVVDQNGEKLTSMNQYEQFITGSDREESWQQPTSYNTAYGFMTFMTSNELTEQRSFIKNDALIFSIDIRNMNSASSKSRSAFVADSPVDDQSHHGSEHEPNQEKPQINVNINMTPNNTTSETNTDGMMAIGSAIGIAMTCTFVAMAIMLAVVISINNTHKKSIRAMSTFVKQSNGDKTGCNNSSYSEQKI